MTLNFPSNPYVGQAWTVGSRTWTWNGTAWAINSGIISWDPFTVPRVVITSATNATSTTTGALIVAGGAGIAGDLYVGNIYSNGNLLLNSSSTFAGGNVTAPIHVIDLTQSLNPATGALTVAGGVGIGGDLHIQGNIYDPYGSIIGNPNGTNNIFTINNYTASTSNDSGALVVKGGAGIGGDLYVGNIYSNGSLLVNSSSTFAGGTISAATRITDATASTGTTTGALTVVGGVGIGGALYVGDIYSNGNLIVNSSSTFAGGTISAAVHITDSTPTGSSSTGALIIDGGVGIHGSIYAAGTITATNVTVRNQLSVNGGLTMGSSIYSDFSANNITSQTTLILDAWGGDFYRTVKYLVQVVDTGFTPNHIHSAELLLTHDNNGPSTIAYLVQYGVVVNYNELGIWGTDFTSGIVSLTFTPSYLPVNMNIKINRLGITM